MRTTGLVLAAGAGRRMGRPKALVGSWLVDAVTALREGGCDAVTVVLGASAEPAARRLVGYDAQIVVASDWAEGMGSSLRAGLSALTANNPAADPALPVAAVVTLVDLPDVGAAVVRRLLDRPVCAQTLVRAAYGGRPGHPVLLGRDHWTGAADSATGDQGARAYLSEHHADLVECGDLATGRDVDAAPRTRHWPDPEPDPEPEPGIDWGIDSDTDWGSDCGPTVGQPGSE